VKRSIGLHRVPAALNMDLGNMCTALAREQASLNTRLLQAITGSDGAPDWPPSFSCTLCLELGIL